MLQSSNPVLSPDADFERYYGTMSEGRSATVSDTATLKGIANKTGILAVACVAFGALGYSLLPQLGTSVLWMSAIAGFVVTLGVGFMIRANPKVAAIGGWIYAAVQGIFLGALTALLDGMLANAIGAEAAAKLGGSLALPAFLITAGAMASMLMLYKAGIVRPTERFKSVMAVLIGAVMITYLAAFVLSFFSVQIPFLSLSSATQGGSAGLIGLGISLLIFGIASFSLILDFGRAEDIVNAGAPKAMEWVAAFGLLVSLAWVYYEAVKLVFRLAILFNQRD
jgi:uncharacterized YccA/Bax inhibitor family protein